MTHLEPGSIQARFEAGLSFSEVLETAHSNGALWRAVYDRSHLDEAATQRIAAIRGRWNLLVLSEDWCGDAVNTLPVIARVAEASPHFSLRVLARDMNLDLMDAHLTAGARAIPVVVVYDECFVERGFWGPRPAELQHWVRHEGTSLPKDARYKHIRGWYARDRGRATASELISVIEGGAGARAVRELDALRRS